MINFSQESSKDLSKTMLQLLTKIIWCLAASASKWSSSFSSVVSKTSLLGVNLVILRSHFITSR